MKKCLNIFWILVVILGLNACSNPDAKIDSPGLSLQPAGEAWGLFISKRRQNIKRFVSRPIT